MSEQMNDYIKCGYSNIDDMICDKTGSILNHVIMSALTRVNRSLNENIQIKWSDIPEETMNEWDDFIFHYDVTQWKPCTDDRAFPGTYYNNELIRILEYRAYELRSIVMKWIREKYNC